jgi:hypothetical protein
MTGNNQEGSGYFQGFTCELMKSNNVDELVCFCSHGHPLEIASFIVSINSDLQIINNSFTYLSLTSQANYIRTITSQDKTKSLVVFCDNDSKGYYTIFDLKTMTFTEKISYMTIRGGDASTLLIKYFPRTQEYILISKNEREFKALKFDKNMNRIQNDNMNDETTADFNLSDNIHNINFFNVVYFLEYENYIIIVDGSIDGITASRGYLLPDAYKPDEIFPFPIIISTTINAKPSTIPLKDTFSSIINTMPFSQIHTSSITSSSIMNHLSNISSSIMNHLSSTSSSTMNHKFTTFS